MSIARPLRWKLLRTPPTRRLRSRERQVLVTRPHCEPRLAAALMLIRPPVTALVTARVAWLTGSAISAASPATARTPKSVVDAAAHAGAALISRNVPANAFNMRETPRVAEACIHIVNRADNLPRRSIRPDWDGFHRSISGLYDDRPRLPPAGES